MSIEFDKNNYRVHNERNKSIIENSLKEYGAGRSILLDADDTIIAGNGTYEQAQKLGIPVQIIETDGNTLIALQRTDLDTNDEKREGLSVVDNSASDSSSFDRSKMTEHFSVDYLQTLGVPVVKMDDVPVDDLLSIKKEPEKKKKIVKCPYCGEDVEV